MSQLSQLLDEFVVGRVRFVDRDGGVAEQVREMSLLSMLEEAKTLRSGKGRGVAGSSMPVSGDPLVIEADMVRQIHGQVGVHNRCVAASLALPQRLRFWANLVPESVAVEWLVYWAGLIRGLFESSVELCGVCPECGSGGEVEVVDGVRTFRRALRVWKESLRAGCWVCGAEWVGELRLRELAGRW